MGVTVRQATTAADYEAVRDLCWAYRDFLLALGEPDKTIIETLYPAPDYAALLDRLEDEHAPPHGAGVVAELDGAIIGCGMSHALEPDVSEIKRVFVRPRAQGHGAGAAICSALIKQAHDAGFRLVRLDTSKSLRGAQALYPKLGFAPRGPYQAVPEIAKDHLLYYELEL